MIIFYSWQSDLPEGSNRLFIESCLKTAIEQLNGAGELHSAVREQDTQSGLILDQDTQGVLGTPDVAATIFRKIDECDIFVADVSFTGKSLKNKKLTPNSNVMLELGYAMGKHGDEKIILIMDRSYGDPKNLPFDLRHKRWPLSFSSRNKLGAFPFFVRKGNLDNEKQILIGHLVEMLKGYLSLQTVEVKPTLKLLPFVAVQHDCSIHIIFALKNTGHLLVAFPAVRFFSSSNFKPGALQRVNKYVVVQPYDFQYEPPFDQALLIKKAISPGLHAGAVEQIARFDMLWKYDSGVPFKELVIDYELVSEDGAWKSSLCITEEWIRSEGRIR